jgi:hypothetical protein
VTGGGSVIDELFIALGFQVDKTGFGQIRQQVDEAKSSLLSIGGAVKAFVAGFAIKEIADIGSTFEQNQIQIAGFLSALGQSSDFTAGLKDAAGVIQQITKDAAILPGEAQEYIDVFKAGLPFVQAAMPGGSLGDITKFTNQLTAIGKTFGLDSGLIAREFDHMLSPGKGMASLRLPLFRQLLSFMPKLAGGARVTAESFNAMSAPQRLALLQSTFEKLQPMLDASATSFDAMWGAAVSALKQMTRFATVPLFKAFKQGLDKITAAFVDANGEQTAFGKSLTDSISTGLKYILQLLSAGAKMVAWLGQTRVGAFAFKAALTLLGTALTGLAVSQTIGAFVKLFGVLTNLKMLLTGGLFAAIALIAEDLYVFATGGESVTGLLVERFGPALTAIGAAVTALGATILYLVGPFKAVGLAIGFMGKNIGMVIGMLGRLVGFLFAQAVPMAIRWAIAFGPVTLAVAAIGALIFGLYELKKHWGDISAFIGGKWDWILGKINAAKEALGIGDGTPVVQDMGGGGVMAAPAGGAPGAGGGAWAPWSPGAAGAGGAAPWSPGAAASPMVASGGDTTITQQTTNHVTVNVKSTDPKAAGREVRKTLIRNSQSGVKY